MKIQFRREITINGEVVRSFQFSSEGKSDKEIFGAIKNSFLSDSEILEFSHSVSDYQCKHHGGKCIEITE